MSNISRRKKLGRKLKKKVVKTDDESILVLNRTSEVDEDSFLNAFFPNANSTMLEDPIALNGDWPTDRKEEDEPEAMPIPPVLNYSEFFAGELNKDDTYASD